MEEYSKFRRVKRFKKDDAVKRFPDVKKMKMDR